MKRLSEYSLCIMAGLVVLSYAIYMICGPGGDGLIFASVVGAIGVIAGVKLGGDYN
jgi:hypothetical protein